MGNIKEMTIDELLAEAKVQRTIESEARYSADNCEREAIYKFLRENRLNGIVIHKNCNIKGQLCVGYDNYSGYIVDFFPLKKNGEVSNKRDVYCSEWIACLGISENFKRLLTCYEPCEDMLSDETQVDILNEIIRLLSEQNRKQIELTDYLLLDKSTFSAWKSGKSESYKKYLPEISRFFSITIDELVNNSLKNCEKTQTTAIEKYRKMKGMTQCDLADKLGVTASAISQYESGKREPSIVQLKRLAKILDCTTDQLLSL